MMAFQVIRLGMQVVGTIAQAKAQKAAAKASAQTAEYNASVDEQNRLAQLQSGANEAKNLRVQARQLRASQRAKLASQGAITGSALDLLTETTVQSEMDIMNINRNAQIKANQSLSNANLNRWKAKSALAAGSAMARSTLITGLAGAGMSAYNMGMFGSGSSSSASVGSPFMPRYTGNYNPAIGGR